MVVPVDEEEARHKLEGDAMAFHEIVAEGTEDGSLEHALAYLDGTIHAVIDLDLKVEVVRGLGLGLGEFVEEVMQQQEVIVVVFKGQG